MGWRKREGEGEGEGEGSIFIGAWEFVLGKASGIGRNVEEREMV